MSKLDINVFLKAAIAGIVGNLTIGLILLVLINESNINIPLASTFSAIAGALITAILLIVYENHDQ